jgi:UDP-glucose:(heptosyl)LPS alpha-1,3-glucosyltransferase
MNIGLCYESVLPARGGCETYIADLTRRLVNARHEVHLYACRWDEAALPSGLRYHRQPDAGGPRFLRPWRFAAACERAIAGARLDVTIGFDKTWGQDVLYPQGGLHTASVEHNLRKYPDGFARMAARALKAIDPAVRSFTRLERKQYLAEPRPMIVVNSEMVRGHFQRHYGIAANQISVLRAAVDPSRFRCHERREIRQAMRSRWGVDEEVPVGLFVAMNYRLKGLEPLLYSVRLMPPDRSFRLVVVGNPRFERYQRLARRLGIGDRVTFHGFCADSRHVYFASDFLVHPTFYDPCSLVVLEAQACGLPVITSRFNGAAELMHPPQDGIVIDDPHDHHRLAEAMTAMTDAHYRRSAAAAALLSAGLWTFDHHYRKMIAILESTANCRRISRAA